MSKRKESYNCRAKRQLCLFLFTTHVSCFLNTISSVYLGQISATAQICNTQDSTKSQMAANALHSIAAFCLEIVKDVVWVYSSKTKLLPDTKDSKNTQFSGNLYVMKQRSSRPGRVPDTGCPSCDFTAVQRLISMSYQRFAPSNA